MNLATSASYVSIVPWYNATTKAPFSIAYSNAEWDWAKYIVTFGYVLASSTCFLGTGLAIPRYLFALSRDGLIMSIFSKINERTKVYNLIANKVMDLIYFFILILK